MVSTVLLAAALVSVFGDDRNFPPKQPLGLPYNEDRLWLHLNPKCFAIPSEVHQFKKHLLNQYSCITYNEERRNIYKHPLSANYSVWSLWFEKNNSFDCLDATIALPPNVLSACIDDVYFEPLQYVTDYTCGVQGTNDGVDLWSLDILDGTADDIYIHPSWSSTDKESVSVEAIILDTMVDDTHVEFVGLDSVNLYTGYLNPRASYDHGTHVAGTVVGHDVGGAKNTALRYYPVCQLGGSCAWSDIESGYNTAIAYMQKDDTKRYVINYSVGGLRSTLNDEAYDAWGKQINDAGGIWVTSAGNSDADACGYAPAFSEEALTIGAYDVHNEAAWFTNYGECVDTWGPGVYVYSAAVGGGYVAFSGTSMSSPNIASLVVNLLKEKKNLDLDDVKEYMIENARSVNNNGKEGTMNQAYLKCAK